MAIEQKDIDRLLLCRAVIDKYRVFNTARIESLATAKSVTEAKAIIETKIGVATTISADSAIKPVSDIKSALEPERTKYTLEMYEILHQQGFETYQAFVDFNNKLNFESYKESYPLEGRCDWCGKKAFIDQPCLTAPEVYPLYPMEPGKNCKYEMIVNGTWEVDDYVYVLFMARLEKRDEKYTEPLDEKLSILMGDTISPISICPIGHGFHIIKDKMKPLPFNVFWRA